MQKTNFCFFALDSSLIESRDVNELEANRNSKNRKKTTKHKSNVSNVSNYITIKRKSKTTTIQRPHSTKPQSTQKLRKKKELKQMHEQFDATVGIQSNVNGSNDSNSSNKLFLQNANEITVFNQFNGANLNNSNQEMFLTTTINNNNNNNNKNNHNNSNKMIKKPSSARAANTHRNNNNIDVNIDHSAEMMASILNSNNDHNSTNSSKKSYVFCVCLFVFLCPLIVLMLCWFDICPRKIETYTLKKKKINK